MENSNNQTIDLKSLDDKQSLFIIWQMLNKAQSKGVFTIDEACAVKAAVQKIRKTVETNTSTDKDV